MLLESYLALYAVAGVALLICVGLSIDVLVRYVDEARRAEEPSELLVMLILVGAAGAAVSKLPPAAAAPCAPETLLVAIIEAGLYIVLRLKLADCIHSAPDVVRLCDISLDSVCIIMLFRIMLAQTELMIAPIDI